MGRPTSPAQVAPQSPGLPVSSPSLLEIKLLTPPAWPELYAWRALPPSIPVPTPPIPLLQPQDALLGQWELLGRGLSRHVWRWELWKKIMPACLGDCLQDNCGGSHKREEFTGVDGWLQGKKDRKGGKRKRLNLILKSEVQMNTDAMEHPHPPPPSPHSPLSRRKSEGDGGFHNNHMIFNHWKMSSPLRPSMSPTKWASGLSHLFSSGFSHHNQE